MMEWYDYNKGPFQPGTCTSMRGVNATAQSWLRLRAVRWYGLWTRKHVRQLADRICCCAGAGGAPENPFNICLCLLDRALPDLVRCAAGRRFESALSASLHCNPHNLWRSLTPHLEPRADLGQLDLLVRRLDMDVVPAEDAHARQHKLSRIRHIAALRPSMIELELT